MIIMNLINIRASSLSELFDCPARWEAKHVLNMNKTTSGSARLGTAWHEATACYDIAKINGKKDEQTLDYALYVFEKVIEEEREQEVIWDDGEKESVMSAGSWLVKEYVSQWADKIQYVEIETTHSAIELNDIGLRITGTTDAIVKDSSGSYCVLDKKSGANAVSASGEVEWRKHWMQLGVYEILAGQRMDINGAPMVLGGQVAKTEKGRRMSIVQLPESPRSRLLGSEEMPGVLHKAAKILNSGNFHGNPNSYLCSKKYCPRHDICIYKM